MNSVQILGNLARDPELRFTKTGRAVATFTVAATNTYIDSTTNETKEQTAFINCVAWGKTGEAVGNCKKGERLLVNGRIQTRSYDTQDGQKRYVTEVVADCYEAAFHRIKAYYKQYPKLKKRKMPRINGDRDMYDIPPSQL